MISDQKTRQSLIVIMSACQQMRDKSTLLLELCYLKHQEPQQQINFSNFRIQEQNFKEAMTFPIHQNLQEPKSSIFLLM